MAHLLAELDLDDFPYHEFHRDAMRDSVARRWRLIRSSDKALARLRAHHYEIDDTLLEEELSVDDLQRAIGFEPEIVDELTGQRSAEMPTLVQATERLVTTPHSDS